MRNREELNSYIQLKVKEKKQKSKRRKNNIFKAACVLILISSVFSFNGLQDDLQKDACSGSSNDQDKDSSFTYDVSSVYSSALNDEFKDTSKPKEQTPTKEDEFIESIFKDSKEYLILKHLFSVKANVDSSYVHMQSFLAASGSSSFGSSDAIFENNSISITWGSEKIEKTLSSEEVELLYSCVKNIKPESVVSSGDSLELYGTENIVIKITFQNKNYYIYIVNKYIRLNNNKDYFAFNREVIDVFLESIKKSVVE